MNVVHLNFTSEKNASSLRLLSCLYVDKTARYYVLWTRYRSIRCNAKYFQNECEMFAPLSRADGAQYCGAYQLSDSTDCQ